MDIVGSVFGIIITSPIMLLSAILVKCSSPGPVIFRQERVGLHNKSFYMYKFRSMAMQTAAEEKKGWTVRNDPRVTGIGKILRRTSIDELPQLFNILKGDMSLVGPRPERPQFVEKFKEEIPRYMVKHQVRPGLTGWAQVNGLRGDSSIKKRIEYDIYYIENWTLGFDIKIILMTFFTGFINKNETSRKRKKTFREWTETCGTATFRKWTATCGTATCRQRTEDNIRQRTEESICQAARCQEKKKGYHLRCRDCGYPDHGGSTVSGNDPHK